MLRVHKPSKARLRLIWTAAALLSALMLLAACGQPAAAPPAEVAATEAPAEEAAEPTEAPAEEAAEPTEEPAEEEAEPTAVAEEEAEPTAVAEEEAEPTAVAEEEAAEATPTAMAEEEPAASMGDPVAGEYLINTARGCGCHFNGDLGGRAGGNEFEGPFGVVYSANITPHPETGIGGLTDQQVADSIRFGKRADGDNLFLMPKFAFLSDKDVMDIVAYLRAQEPIENAVPARELNFEPPAFEVTTPPPAEAPTEPVERGGYLVALARCTQCHTPTNEDGSPQEGMFLAGAPFRDTVAPNLTPDEATGLGAWTEEEIVDFLATGKYSDGSEPHEAMVQVTQQATSKLTPEDRAAIATYLKSLAPVENLPATPQ